ncbi:metallophosphoesterase [Sporichthya sp.]|uniref:metallophosphoesterase family protein n=1 Tax=Sporichthya sp. TaxID=65475 RepID=UPI0017AB96B7|nr:metallophosphoesterase [Sporichthya sp.]MBA3742580.1 metallophosphoesterase [Sporichthya sp.]
MLDRLRRPSTAQVLRRGLRRTLPRRVPVRKLGRLVGFVAVVLIGAYLGLLVGGRETTSVGPVNTHMNAGLSWSGDTEIRVGPLGTLTLDTHDGPIGVTVTVDQLNVNDARTLFDDPAAFEGLESWISSDARDAVIRLVIRSAASAVLGAVLLSLVVYRRRFRRVAFVGVAAAATVMATLGTAAATWNPRSVAEPKYTGLLVSAPSVVGNAQDIVSSFTDYSQGLAKLVGNVSKLYDVTSTLPAYEPDSSTIRVLHVADIHLNPAAWDVIKSISEQFKVALIIDAGDISDHGSRAERRFVDKIADLSVPYVFVRGNHDSQAIAEAVAAQPNAVVLEAGESHNVAGLRIAGESDPRFTPDRSNVVMTNEQLAFLGRDLAWQLTRAGQKPDLAVIHDPTMGYPLDGAVPLVLAGHSHARSTKLLENGTRIFIQGSSGGAGLRALEGESPTPIECSVLYFDAATKRLAAWDDISIGGLGLTSAQINRTIAPERAGEFERKAAEQKADAFQGP